MVILKEIWKLISWVIHHIWTALSIIFRWAIRFLISQSRQLTALNEWFWWTKDQGVSSLKEMYERFQNTTLAEETVDFRHSWKYDLTGMRHHFTKKYIYTINHKRIALNYLYFSVFSGLGGASLASFIRLELAYPGSHFFKGDSIRYIQVISAHGLVMIFYVVVPIIFGFFANYFIPYHILSKDVAFPRLNSIGFWLLPAGFIMMSRPAFTRRQVYKPWDPYEAYQSIRKDLFKNFKELIERDAYGYVTNSYSLKAIEFHLFYHHIHAKDSQTAVENGILARRLMWLLQVQNPHSQELYLNARYAYYDALRIFYTSGRIEKEHAALGYLLKKLYEMRSTLKVKASPYRPTPKLQGSLGLVEGKVLQLVDYTSILLGKPRHLARDLAVESILTSIKGSATSADKTISARFIVDSIKRILTARHKDSASHVSKFWKELLKQWDLSNNFTNQKPGSGDKLHWKLKSNIVGNRSIADFYWHLNQTSDKALMFEPISGLVWSIQKELKGRVGTDGPNKFEITQNWTKNFMLWEYNWMWYENPWQALRQAVKHKSILMRNEKCSNPASVMAGWAFITPFSAQTRFTGFGSQDVAIVSVLFAGLSTTISFTNLLITRRVMGSAGFKNRKNAIPFLSISLLLVMRMLSLITPVLGAAMMMLLMDRHWKTSYFDYAYGGDAILFHHLFWFFGHPEVYVVIIPAFGIVNSILPYYNKRRITSKNHLVWATYVMAYMGFLVWGHHMYLIGLDHRARSFYSTITVMISLPAVVKIVNWTLTFLNGTLYVDISVYFVIAFFTFFLSGGLTGLWLSHVALNLYVHDTFYVVAHFHFMFSGATFSAIFAGIYFYYREIFGVIHSRFFATLHFIFWFFGQWITFMPLYWVGYNGLPRRYHDYPVIYMGWHGISSSGHILTIIGIMFFLLGIFHSKFTKRGYVPRQMGLPRTFKTAQYTVLKKNKLRAILYLLPRLDIMDEVYLNKS